MVFVWALAFAGIIVAKLLGGWIPWIGGQSKAVAALLFLYLPSYYLRRRKEYVDDYAVPPWPWTSRIAAKQFVKDVSWAGGVSILLFPLVFVGFFGFLDLLELLPEEVHRYLAPYRLGSLGFTLRFPANLGLHVLDQFLVVALPEEFFYRGYLQTRLSKAWGEGRVRLLGAQVGRAFWATQVLFALGHLAELHVWRLGVFFPALLFGWLRARTGSIVPGIIVHALSNLVIMTLEASVFGK